MYAGKLVERAPTHALLDTPKHPYTKGLLSSSVEVGGRARPLVPIPGTPPDPAWRPEGCPFHPRCSEAEAGRCHQEQELIEIAPHRDVACWKVGESA